MQQKWGLHSKVKCKTEKKGKKITGIKRSLLLVEKPFTQNTQSYCTQTKDEKECRPQTTTKKTGIRDNYLGNV